jgi:hypothetical protein
MTKPITLQFVIALEARNQTWPLMSHPVAFIPSLGKQKWCVPRNRNQNTTNDEACPCARIRPIEDLLRHDRERAVIVAMVTVRVVQASVNKIVDVISMRHSLVTASRSMLMRSVVPACPVLGPTSARIVSGDLQDVLLYAVAFYMVQVSVLEIVNVILVSNRDMPAARAMYVWSIGVSRLVDP